MSARRRLGAGPLAVSALALGTWRTFERVPREQGLEVLRAARSLGIDFFDDARYDDETGVASIATGYSEVLFGELFRASGLRREDVVVSEKLWWQFWPRESAAAELDASLARLRFDAVDLIYCVTLPEGLRVEAAVAEVAGLLSAGRARAWGVANWSADALERATHAAATLGIDAPCAVQLPYSLVNRAAVENGAMSRAVAAAGAGIVASAVLEGGILTGRYDGSPGADGRMAGDLAAPGRRRALDAGAALRALALDWGTCAAALAVAFALDHPQVASVLVGATSAAQLAALHEGIALHAGLGEDDRRHLRELAGG